MTTELEQEFFKVFGIKQKCKRGKIVCAGRASNKCPTCQNNIYPEITDRILLELICILQRFKDITFNNLYFENIEHLKNEVLSQIYKCKLKLHEFNAKQLQHQIQQLFKEEE